MVAFSFLPMKRFAAVLIAAAASAHAQLAVMHTNGVVTSPTNLTIQQSNVAGLSQALNGKLATNGSAGGLTNFPANLLSHSNGVVIYTNTNVLSFAKGIEIKGPDTTNIPTFSWQTSDGVGDGSMLAFSRRHATNLWFGINQTNWSQGAWGQNIQPTADGNNFTRKNTNFGSVSLVLENEYNFEQNTNNPPRTVAEMYFRVDSADGTQFRPLMFVGSQTNPVLGYGGSYYPFTVQTTNLGFNATHAFTVDFANPGAGATMQVRNMATNSGTYAQLEFINSASTMAFFAKQNKFEMYANHSPSFHVLQSVTNGVIIGGSFASSAAARVQLGGDTRIDGAISFDNTTSAATTLTNLGLGSGITTNVSSGTLQFSNGILVGHTP
jgi:hypothetical protein